MMEAKSCNYRSTLRGSFRANGVLKRWVCSAVMLAITASSSASAQMTQREILLNFFESCNGPEWTDNTNWADESISLCEWFGITCDDSEAVEQLELRKNNVICLLPPDIFQLPALKVLDLSHNEELVVDFTQLDTERTANVEQLYLADCEVSSLLGLDTAFATSLSSLSVAGGSITGPFPPEILQLSLLKDIDISYNFISGEIPTEIGDLDELEVICFAHNFLEGEIPLELGGLSNLFEISLQFNQMSGALPTELNQLVSLASLSINNQKNGDEGGLVGSLLEFSNQPFLYNVNLAYNQLSGEIPQLFLAALDDSFSSLIMVDLSNNLLTGQVPQTLTRFSAIRIFLIKNMIQAVPDELCDQSDWFFGEVGQFGCDAILCPPGTFGLYGRQISVGYPCEPCPGGQGFYGGTSCEAALETAEEEPETSETKKTFRWKKKDYTTAADVLGLNKEGTEATAEQEDSLVPENLSDPDTSGQSMLRMLDLTIGVILLTVSSLL